MIRNGLQRCSVVAESSNSTVLIWYSSSTSLDSRVVGVKTISEKVVYYYLSIMFRLGACYVDSTQLQTCRSIFFCTSHHFVDPGLSVCRVSLEVLSGALLM